MLGDGVGHWKRSGKAGFCGTADAAGASEMLMLPVQQVNGTVTRAAHAAQFLNDALTQCAEIGHRADLGGETSDQVQKICR